ncbi:MAG: CPBP family intramembrane metalloprotease [Alistipes sp.]|nr:CPBP family intramembrane metalloprotease [Alistipes sp.]
MSAWVFAAQIISVSLCRLCGLEFPDATLLDNADDRISLATQLTMAQSLAVIYPISMLLSLGGILLYRKARGGISKIASFSVSGFDPSRLLGLFVLMVAMQVVIEPLTMMMPDTPQMVGRGFFTILVSIVFAPIFEEIICRGIVLESFREKYNIWVGWICSSLFFGVIHGQVTAMFNASMLGLILGYAYIRSNSIFSVVILHALNNGLALALMAFNLGDSTFREIMPTPQIYWSVWAVSFVALAIGFAIMVRNMRRMSLKR